MPQESPRLHPHAHRIVVGGLSMGRRATENRSQFGQALESPPPNAGFESPGRLPAKVGMISGNHGGVILSHSSAAELRLCSWRRPEAWRSRSDALAGLAFAFLLKMPAKLSPAIEGASPRPQKARLSTVIAYFGRLLIAPSQCWMASFSLNGE